MKAFFLTFCLLFTAVQAQDISANKYAKLVQKGEKVAERICDEKKLSKIKAKTYDEISKRIESSTPCITLNKRNKEALIYFLMAGESNSTTVKEAIIVPKESKCPVCGMFVAKYPKWVALIEIESKKHYFDGVKDMMKFYIFDIDFPYDRAKISNIEVTDFYTLKGIKAKEAFYVIGSDIFGPMGDELIPFATKESAQNFLKDHNGEKIVLFKEISPKLVMALDGIEYD
jgi:nitrous oxide reductase accessory protein NosL